MNLVKQAYIAPSIKFFKKQFLDFWNLEEYHDINKPAVFFGISEASSFIEKHQDYKILLPCGTSDYPKIKDYNKVLYMCSDNCIVPENTIRKSLTPKIKNYDKFIPNILGDKIYVYSGFKNGWSIDFNLINDLQKNINFEIITTPHKNLQDYFNIDYLKLNYYDKSFLNLNFTEGRGMASVIELGLMGRKTIFKPFYKNNSQRVEFPNIINYDTMEDVVNIIQEESKKIGTIQPSIDAHNVGAEWLDLDFWLK